MLQALRISLAAALALVHSPIGEVGAQEAVVLYGPEIRIPSGYDSWSLFLVCNPRWLRPEANQDLRHLWWNFDSFGRAIGTNNAAVWFWTTRDPDLERISDYLDVNRSSEYCQRFSLRPSEGPHILVTLSHPDEIDVLEEEYFILKLNGLQPSYTEELVNFLADGIITGGLGQISIESRRFWLGLQYVLSEAFATLGSWVECVSVEIDTSFVTLAIVGSNPADQGAACR